MEGFANMGWEAMQTSLNYKSVCCSILPHSRGVIWFSFTKKSSPVCFVCCCLLVWLQVDESGLMNKRDTAQRSLWLCVRVCVYTCLSIAVRTNLASLLWRRCWLTLTNGFLRLGFWVQVRIRFLLGFILDNSWSWLGMEWGAKVLVSILITNRRQVQYVRARTMQEMKRRTQGK